MTTETNSATQAQADAADTSAASDQQTPLWKPALKEAGCAFLCAGILVSLCYAVFFRSIHPEFVPFMGHDVEKVVALGKDLIPVSVGASRKVGNNIIIEDFNGDEAILVLPRAFRAEDYPFIKVNLSGFTRYSKFKILWRQADNPEKTHALEFNRSGDEVTQIAMPYGGENYRAQIADIALLFYDGPALGFENNNDVDIVISSIEFLPFSAASVAEQIFEDWTNPPLWQGYSNNIVRGIHAKGLMYPNVAITLIVTVAIMITIIKSRQYAFVKTKKNTHTLKYTMLCICLYGFAFNDCLRWVGRLSQFEDTQDRFSQLTLEERALNSALRCSRFRTDCGAHLLPHF